MSGAVSAEQLARLSGVFEDAQRLGFLGPAPVQSHLVHARRYVAALGEEPPRRGLDMGSGAGVPGLVLALHWSSSHWVLLDAAERRTAFLAGAVLALGLSDRVQVCRGRAETLAHEPVHRGTFDLVVSRSFGPPAVVAECAAGFLEVGGRLAVSEPPDTPGAADEFGRRWPREALAQLGLEPSAVAEGVAVMVQSRLCPDVFPRRVGVPTKRPLY